MRPHGRLRAAAEVLADILERHRPTSEALSDWGKSHRFAGSGDRAAIGNLVYDALRRKRSIAARMGSDSARALALGAAGLSLGITPDEVAALADGSEHALEAITAEEQAGLAREIDSALPFDVRGDLPEWLAASFETAYGADAAAEGAALARRAPVDLRVNTLKADRERVLKAFARHGAVETPYSPVGVRLPVPEGPGRHPNVEAEPGHGKGWFEVQDEGSQIAALLAGAGPRQQVLDVCAGAGGKTLALAAPMQNTGQIYAYDADKGQLRPIFERLKRAGARNVQVMEAGDETALAALGARFDVVFLDAPCTGSGVWRRRPDAKWRMRPTALAERLKDQAAVLELGRGLVKPGGRMIYVTCSMLPEENAQQLERFLAGAPEFCMVPYAEVWVSVFECAAPISAVAGGGLQLTPARHGTDGFFIAVLAKAS